MKSFNLSEAKAHFSDLMDQVEHGETITLCKRNKPIARMTPIAPSRSRHKTCIGWAKGSIRILGDLHDPALPASDWDMLA